MVAYIIQLLPSVHNIYVVYNLKSSCKPNLSLDYFIVIYNDLSLF